MTRRRFLQAVSAFCVGARKLAATVSSAFDDLSSPEFLAFQACRPPRTKAELAWYCEHVLRVACEECKGSGATLDPVHGPVPCAWCHGRRFHGFKIPSVAVCTDKGHEAPLDIIWRLYAGLQRSVLLIGNRRGGKTRDLAILEHIVMRFRRRRVSHMGAIEPQAYRAYDYLVEQVGSRAEPPFRVDPATGDPVPHWFPGALPEVEGAPLLSETSFRNGSWIEILPGTQAQASGPSPQLAVLDEVDEAKWPVVQQFSKTPTGPDAQLVLASTHHNIAGTVTRIEKEIPGLPRATFCIWETLARCTYACDDVPLPNGGRGACPLYWQESLTAEGLRERKPLCGGVLARKSDGFFPVDRAIAARLESDLGSFLVQYCCARPEMTVGNRAYSGYGPWTVLPEDPMLDPLRPLVLAADFNVNPMCWAVIQEAPGSTEARPEHHVVDEIVIKNTTTQLAALEFLRRYGPGGSMLPPGAARHVGGVWVVGDATAHGRRTSATATDYEQLAAALGAFVDFRLLTVSGDANPSPVERLQIVNILLRDVLTNWSVLRVAPRCGEMRRELESVMLKPGTSEKDKAGAEQIGLSHIGDALEYWAHKWFPRARIAQMRAAVLATGGERLAARVQPMRPSAVERWDAVQVGPQPGGRAQPDW